MFVEIRDWECILGPFYRVDFVLFPVATPSVTKSFYIEKNVGIVDIKKMVSSFVDDLSVSGIKYSRVLDFPKFCVKYNSISTTQQQAA